MDNKMKFTKTIIFTLTLSILLSIVGCSSSYQYLSEDPGNQENIVILYTNDVHCSVDDYIGYAGVSAYKKAMQATNKYVCLVDNGDHVQGGTIGKKDNGLQIVSIMNAVGYDLAIPGNHEFDYGMPAFATIVKESKAQYLNCNITYTGNIPNNYFENVSSYTIKTFGNTRVGFVGVTAPDTLTISEKSIFYENGKLAWDFQSANNGKALWAAVQKSVDDCKSQNADYVILMSHLGDLEVEEGNYSSINTIKNTKNIDVVLDAHSHSVINSMTVPNIEGKNVILSSTGTAIHNIGKLTISARGLQTELINEKDYKAKDESIAKLIFDIKKGMGFEPLKYESTNELTTKTPDGEWISRSRESTLGDWVADAILFGINKISPDSEKADFAFINGGGVRNNFPKGNPVIDGKPTTEHLSNLDPFDTYLYTATIKGQTFLDMLEYSCMFLKGPLPRVDTDFGGFLQVSKEIKFEVDTNIPSPVKLNDDGSEIITIENTQRRISNVMILDKTTNTYKALDPDKNYIIASTDFILQGNQGYGYFIEKEKVEKLRLRVAVEDYYNHLQGHLEEYAKTQGRIVLH